MIVKISKKDKEIINAIKFVEAGHMKKSSRPLYINFMWLKANGRRYTLVATDGRRVHLVVWKPNPRDYSKVPVIKNYIPVIFRTMSEGMFMLTSIDLGSTTFTPFLSKVLKAKDNAIALGKGLVNDDADIENICFAYRTSCEDRGIDPGYLKDILKRKANNNWEVFIQQDDEHLLVCETESVTFSRSYDLKNGAEIRNMVSSVKTQLFLMPMRKGKCDFNPCKEELNR